MLKKKLGKEKETKIAKCCWSLKMYEDWGMSLGSPGPCTLVTSLSSIQGPPGTFTISDPFFIPHLSPLWGAGVPLLHGTVLIT